MLSIVVCTHDNADSLDVVLDALGSQDPPRFPDGSADWEVVVVDNRCRDHTAAVVEDHVRSGRIPGLRRVAEPVQGLTPARRRGVAVTDRPWVAFVDDDNVLASDWVAAVATAVTHRPEAAAIGGRVRLVPGCERPAWLDGHGWAFAGQDHGDEPTRVDGLAGAGLVIRRAALDASGWTREPLLDDRVGRRLVSGGDVEIVLRIRPHGGLWYDPSLRLDHHLPAWRFEPGYVCRLVGELGVSSFLGSTLTSPHRPAVWMVRAPVTGAPRLGRSLRARVGATLRRRRSFGATLDLRFAVGWYRGWVRLAAQGPRRWRALTGTAREAG